MNRNQVSQSFPFWPHLKEEERKYFTHHLKEVYWEKEAPWVFTQSQCLGLLFLVEGSLSVGILSESGRQIRLFTMEKGSTCVLSASCLLKEFTYPLYIQPQEKTHLFTLEQDNLSYLSKTNIYVENYIYKVALERFSQVMYLVEDILFTKVDKRLAQLLLDASQTNPLIKTTHENLAQTMGTAREVVSRMLKYFAQEGWIETKRGQVRILNRTALENL